MVSTSGALLRDRLQDPINFTCIDDVSYEKGAFLWLIDGRAVSGATLVQDGKVAGICAREKISGDGRLTVPVFRQGIFDVYASGAILVGDPVTLSSIAGDNAVKSAASAAASGANIVGHALETASHAEQFQIQLTLS